MRTADGSCSSCSCPPPTPSFNRSLGTPIATTPSKAIQDAGIEVDVWKIEGVDERADAERIAEQTRAGEGREEVKCVLLGRGASTDKVEQWLRAAAPVEGFIGFAIGRSIWWDALEGFLKGNIERADAAATVADHYLHFVQVYEGAMVS
jgi:myo-inositol catabolism protein IolC